MKIENKKDLALQYYVDREKSLAKCAKIGEITIEEFIMYLGKHKISTLTFSEEDVTNA